MFKNNEFGFSLVELAVACGLAVVIGSMAVAISQSQIDNVKNRAEAYETCGLQRASLAKDMVNGIEPTANPTCTPAPTPAP